VTHEYSCVTGRRLSVARSITWPVALPSHKLMVYFNVRVASTPMSPEQLAQLFIDKNAAMFR
jgi:hypothetical protein